MSDDRITDIYDRLNRTDVHITAMRTELDGIKGAVTSFGSKLDALAGRMSGQHNFEPFKVMAFISMAMGMLASVAAFVIYMSSNVNASRLAVIEWRLNNPPQVVYATPPTREYKQDRTQ